MLAGQEASEWNIKGAGQGICRTLFVLGQCCAPYAPRHAFLVLYCPRRYSQLALGVSGWVMEAAIGIAGQASDGGHQGLSNSSS